MNDASFWSNFFGQFKDLNDWIKALLIISSFVTFTICFLGLLRYREKRDLRAAMAKDIPKTDEKIDQDTLKDIQLEPAEHLIFDARKRIRKLPPQGDTALQIAVPNKSQKSES